MDDISIVSVAERDRWELEHQDGGLPSQSWWYAWALSASGIDPKLGVVRSRGARMLVPFFERDWMGTTDVATVQGLSGASISSSSVAPLALWREYATTQGWIAGYIQLAISTELDDDLQVDEPVAGNEVFIVDLRRGDLLQSASAMIRRKVGTARRRGASLVDDRSVLIESLRRLYPPAMRRLKARPHYDFSPETLGRWALDPTSLILGARIGDAVEAVSLFCVAGDHAEYQVHASSDAGRELTAWLIWNASTRLRDSGVETLNLGGGIRPGDGVHYFKERFHGAPQRLHAVHQIYDRAKYDQLCRHAGAAFTVGWFPAYRAAAARADVN